MKNLILLFTKYPEPGNVKTRLAKDIGNDMACKVYEKLLFNSWYTVIQSSYPYVVCLSPSDKIDEFKQHYNTSVVPQKGDDIGDRMSHNFKQFFDLGYDRIILCGADILDMNPALFQEGFSALENHDCVIGPSYDGGYYAIGFNRKAFRQDIFSGFAWSTPQVYSNTLKIISKSNLSLYTLPRRMDLDTFDDIKEYLSSNESSSDFSNFLNMVVLTCKNSRESYLK